MTKVAGYRHVGTIDITPSPTGYANVLLAILQAGDAKGKAWAGQQVIKAFKAAATLNPDAWGKE